MTAARVFMVLGSDLRDVPVVNARSGGILDTTSKARNGDQLSGG